MGCNSMTGFGSAVKHGQHAVVKVEVRCVNHRFAEFNVRMPRELLALEDETRSLVAQYVARGRVDVYVTLEPHATGKRRMMVDWDLLDELMRLEEEAARRYGLSHVAERALSRNLAYPGILQLERPSDEVDVLRNDVFSAVQEACTQLIAMRTREGDRITQTLFKRLESLATVVERISDSSVPSVETFRERLRRRMEELTGELNENRLLTEIAVFAERVDIDEELIRLQSHLQEARAILQQGSPVGRRLDFLTQELHREINTIGSKSQGSMISLAVVEGKTLIEQLREQAQNLE